MNGHYSEEQPRRAWLPAIHVKLAFTHLLSALPHGDPSAPQTPVRDVALGMVARATLGTRRGALLMGKDDVLLAIAEPTNVSFRLTQLQERNCSFTENRKKAACTKL